MCGDTKRKVAAGKGGEGAGNSVGMVMAQTRKDQLRQEQMRSPQQRIRTAQSPLKTSNNQQQQQQETDMNDCSWTSRRLQQQRSSMGGKSVLKSITSSFAPKIQEFGDDASTSSSSRMRPREVDVATASAAASALMLAKCGTTSSSPRDSPSTSTSLPHHQLRVRRVMECPMMTDEGRVSIKRKVKEDSPQEVFEDRRQSDHSERNIAKRRQRHPQVLASVCQKLIFCTKLFPCSLLRLPSPLC